VIDSQPPSRGWLSDGVITIRPFRLSDLAELYAATFESLTELRAWMTWCRANYSMEDCRRYLTHATTEWKQENEYNFAIVDAPDGFLCGSIALNRVNRLRGSANVGYWVRMRRTGHGIASRALRLAASFGFRELGLERLEMVIPEGNLASQRVAQKAEARVEQSLAPELVLNGVLHRTRVYSLVAASLNPVTDVERPA
jgi:RimJ/RimL family protein N-acetyltransferase